MFWRGKDEFSFLEVDRKCLPERPPACVPKESGIPKGKRQLKKVLDCRNFRKLLDGQTPRSNPLLYNKVMENDQKSKIGHKSN